MGDDLNKKVISALENIDYSIYEDNFVHWMSKDKSRAKMVLELYRLKIIEKLDKINPRLLRKIINPDYDKQFYDVCRKLEGSGVIRVNRNIKGRISSISLNKITETIIEKAIKIVGGHFE